MSYQIGATLQAAPRDGVDLFLERFCNQPELLLPAFKRSRRMVSTKDGGVLCEKGDEANGIWIVADGLYRVEDDGELIGIRRAGDLVGEQSYYRPGPDEDTKIRGATIRAVGSSAAMLVDSSVLVGLSAEQRAIWHETCARVLSAKLDEATNSRSQFRRRESILKETARRFVSEEGLQAASAAYVDGDFQRYIDAEQCGAVIWFSDIQGFSRYSTARPPKEVAVAVREIMDIQARVISEHGGQIDKFMGDGLMAFWKAPDSKRVAKAADRAVRAAFECVADLQAYFKKAGLPCDVRVGLHAGSVVFGDFGGGERVAFTMIGEAVNTASRYEQARECSEKRELGRLRISESLFALLSDQDLSASFEDAPRTIVDKGGLAHSCRVANI